jgi:hypothetical protein
MPNIDFYYDTADNTLETIVDSGFVINQGQANNLVFRFFFKDYDTNTPFTVLDIVSNQCLINIQRPDNSASNNIVASANTTNICYNLNVSDWALGVAGTLKITAKLFNPSTNITTTYGLGTLQILPSATISLDTIEDQQYQAILDALVDVNSATYIVRASENIAAGDLVTFAGTLGASGKILVAKARASGSFNINTNPEYIFGVAKDAMLHNAEGRVVTNGLIRDINTNAYTQGAILYPNIAVAGGLTNTPAVPPNNRMPIAVSIYSHQNQGILIVRPSFFPTMKQVKDVDTTNIALYGSNSVLKYNSSTLRWEVVDGRMMFGTIYYNTDPPAAPDTFDGMLWLNKLS